ncbi:hypothetical protein PG988_009923 [Apiospora saccharicola]
MRATSTTPTSPPAPVLQDVLFAAVDDGIAQGTVNDPKDEAEVILSESKAPGLVLSFNERLRHFAAINETTIRVRVCACVSVCPAGLNEV